MSTAMQQEQAATHAARYEELRPIASRQVMSGRLGLGVVLQEGLAAWLEQWSQLPVPTPLPSAATATAVALPEAACPQIVHVLSAMALGHLGEVSA